MKAIIHIGTPKSGSSSIQAFLGMNRNALQRRGVVYAPFNSAFGSQFEFAVTALEGCNQIVPPELERRRLRFGTRADQTAYVAAYRDYLDDMLQRCTGTHFIGSSEHIHAWLRKPQQIATLDEFLCARFSSVEYLVYLRAQPQLVTSTYSEAIRRGATHDFATHLERHAVINHWAQLKPWVHTVTRARLRVRLVCSDVLENGDLLHDFCKYAEIASAGLRQPPRVNAALSLPELALRRRLNQILPVLGRDGRHHWLYRGALRLLCPVVARNPRPLGLTEIQGAEIIARNAEGNEKLRKKLFPMRPALF